MRKNTYAFLLIPMLTIGLGNAVYAEKKIDDELIQILNTYSIPNTQDPEEGAFFIGEEFTAKPLPEQPRQIPEIVNMHGDSGNAKVSKYSGPLGVEPEVVSLAGLNSQFLFDKNGRLNGANIDVDDNYNMQFSIGAFDPETLELLAKWTPPDNHTLNTPYMSQTLDGQILVASKEGSIFILERSGEKIDSGFTLIEHLDLVSMRIIESTHTLLGASLDKKNNIWFYTGGIVGNGDTPGSDTILGYIDNDRFVHQMKIENQIVENGIAVNQKGVYVVTGPAGTDDVPSAKGYIFVFEANKNERNGIKTLWKEEYQAGSNIKPGGFARGSGSTPTLLGRRYLAITDNSDNQINAQIYHQNVNEEGQLVCSVPLFDYGYSANDIGIIGIQNENISSIIALNIYNAPLIADSTGDMSSMASGMERIDINKRGNCITRWRLPIKIKSVPVVSEKTGLIYGYTQDEDLAYQGTYVWYFVAVDYETGEIVWKVRAGAGNLYDDSYRAAVLTPDNKMIQSVRGGNVILADGGSFGFFGLLSLLGLVVMRKRYEKYGHNISN